MPTFLHVLCSVSFLQLNCKEYCITWKERHFGSVFVKATERRLNGKNYEELVDGNDSKFLAPASMKAVFDQSLENKPQSIGDYFRCAYRSLALCYRKAIEELENNAGKQYEKLYIVGGGAKNEFLNNLTRQFTGKEVIALPIEATALGNLKIQMEVK